MYTDPTTLNPDNNFSPGAILQLQVRGLAIQTPVTSQDQDTPPTESRIASVSSKLVWEPVQGQDPIWDPEDTL
jgi:hypothetical protein